MTVTSYLLCGSRELYLLVSKRSHQVDFLVNYQSKRNRFKVKATSCNKCEEAVEDGSQSTGNKREADRKALQERCKEASVGKKSDG